MSEKHRTYLDGDRLRSRSFPLASTLPLYPPVKAAALAVEDILRREFITGDEARERIRVEITRDVEREIRRLVSPNETVWRAPRDGPMEIMGVSFYVVDRLPEPGWRVRGMKAAIAAPRFAQPCSAHEYIEPNCPDCGKLA